MATRNTQPVTIIPHDDDTDPSHSTELVSSQVTQQTPEETEESVVDRLRALMAQSPSERIKVKAFRFVNGVMSWCDDFTPEEFEDGDLKMLRDRHGPGKYEIRLMNSRGIAKRIQIHISPASEPPEPARQSDAPQASSELSQVLAMLAENQNRILQALSEKPDPMAQMTQMMTMAKMMREAFAPAPVASSPASDPMAMIGQVFTMVREAKSAVKELVDDEKPGPDPENPMSMIPSILELVKTGMSSNQQPQQLQPIMLPQSVAQPMRIAPQENAAPEQPQQPPQPEPETVETLIVKGLLEDLCQLAKDGKPASEGGSFIYEKIPDQLIDMMGQRYWFEIVAMKFAFIKEHETWLREAKAEADKLFANPPPEDEHDHDPEDRRFNDRP